MLLPPVGVMPGAPVLSPNACASRGSHLRGPLVAWKNPKIGHGMDARSPCVQGPVTREQQHPGSRDL